MGKSRIRVRNVCFHVKYRAKAQYSRLSLWQLCKGVLAPPRPGAGEEWVAKMKEAEHCLAAYVAVI
jgi:hypothetical protein